ncbi:Pol protein [Phytophthora palmivora]|uniref:Pol protein n=1 Tax=Phytophthora palmivora TaxID=4796 RepID=A0A2P4Y4M3_9STRA|nr:Pol protein [Phytophthora palmivora]
MSVDFFIGHPTDGKGNTGILVFRSQLSKMVHFAPVRDKVTGKLAAQLFLDSRDQQNVLEDTLRSFRAEAPRSWSDQLPVVGFALNNAVHASTGLSPFFLNGLRHPNVPLTFLGGTDATTRRYGVGPDKQKGYSDKNGRGNLSKFKRVVSSGESNKSKHHFIGPFAVLARHVTAYTIVLPKSITKHPTFYVSGTTINWVLLLGRRKTKVRAHLLKSGLSLADHRSGWYRSL